MSDSDDSSGEVPMRGDGGGEAPPYAAVAASQAAQHHMTRAMNSLRRALEAEGYQASGGVIVTQVDVEDVGPVVTALSFPMGEWESVADLAEKAAEIFREQEEDPSDGPA